MRVSVVLKIMIPFLLTGALLIGCEEYTEENLARYKELLKPKFVTPQRSSCEEYEKSMPNNQWQLIWSDEFDYTGLPDDSKWDYDDNAGGSGWGNGELQHYTQKRLENARVENGKLIIEVKIENDGNSKYFSSARLVTRNKASWTCGKLDIKAKTPPVEGSCRRSGFYPIAMSMEIGRRAGK